MLLAKVREEATPLPPTNRVPLLVAFQEEQILFCIYALTRLDALISVERMCCVYARLGQTTAQGPYAAL